VKIAMVDPSLFTIPYDRELVRALEAAGACVTLYGRRLRAGEELPPSVRMAPRFYGLSERLPKAARKPVKGLEHVADMALLAARMATDAPAVIHFQWCPLPKVDAIALRLLRRIAPLVLTVHDPNPYNGMNLGIMNSGAEALPRSFDAVIVHSEAGKARLVRNAAAERIYVVPHGPLAVLRSERASGPHENFTIVFFGKIKPYKGLDTLIAALAGLPPGLKQKTRLIVAGQPAMNMSEIHALAQRSGIAISWNLRFIPDREIDSYLRQADLFAFPYRDIDASGVMMSCLAYAKPIVATRIGAFAAQLRDGVHGRLIAASAPPAAFTEAIGQIMTNPGMADRMGAEVGRLLDRLPGWDEIARETLLIYRRARDRWSCQPAEVLATR
jgi:glycosyltransferase involved in cell wall biosynthesis